MWAHPRSRGEHSETPWLLAVDEGSSPLARGALLGRNRRCLPTGLIPARAGSTNQHRLGPYPRGAHPRSRGEHKNLIPKKFSFTGSSPLARGALVFNAVCFFISGLIPARAGSTPWFSSLVLFYWAHPRSRGEHLVVFVLGVLVLGSSPLARGAQILVAVHVEGLGLIPARAGSTPPQGL